VPAHVCCFSRQTLKPYTLLLVALAVLLALPALLPIKPSHLQLPTSLQLGAHSATALSSETAACVPRSLIASGQAMQAMSAGEQAQSA
jgi:hypothetical protein